MGWEIDQIDGFTKTEYLVTFIAILFGYISSEYFKGFGLLFRYRQKTDFPFSFILFSLISFLLLTLYWWNMWDRAFQLEMNFFSFLKIMVYPLFFYFLASFLFKDLSRSDIEGLEDYFFSRKIMLFSVLAGYFLYDQITSYHLEDRIFTLAGILLCVLCILVKNRLIIKIFMITGFSVILVYIVYSVIHVRISSETNENIQHISKAEYLTIFISFIYGFVVSMYFKGWSYLIKDWKSVRYSWSYLIWTLFTFMILISFWWNTWIRSGYMADQLIYFQLSLIPPLLLYMISVVIFPDKKQAKSLNLSEYFENHRKRFFQVFLIFFIVNTGLTLLFREATFIGFTLPFRLVAILINVSALWITARIFHKILPIIAMSAFILYLVLNN
jgi:hypothetical protein